MLRSEFQDLFQRKGYESAAIIGVQGDDDYSIRMFPSIDEDYVHLPVRSVLEAISTDYAYMNGWVLAHSHVNHTIRFSEDDIRITCALSWIARIMGCPMVDHWLFNMSRDVFVSASHIKPGILDPDIKFGYV